MAPLEVLPSPKFQMVETGSKSTSVALASKLPALKWAMALVENATRSPGESELSLAVMFNGAGLKLASALEIEEAELTLEVCEIGLGADTGAALTVGFDGATGAGFVVGFGTGLGAGFGF